VIPDTDITALILCGGQGRRFGNDPKPLATLKKGPNRRALVDHVIATLPASMSILISANSHLADYEARAPVIRDIDLGAQNSGPLLGIYSALGVIDTPWLLVCPADMPLLGPEWYRPLANAQEQRPGPRVIHDGIRLQSLLCLIPLSVCQDLQDYLEQGGQSVRDWHRRVHALEVNVGTNANAFINVNTREELAILEQSLLQR
jgi:molybdopterin-guanine dinucleotide biosynthesis protein A